MFDRKKCKQNARKMLKAHYVMAFCMCLMTAFIGAKYTPSYDYVKDELRTLTGESETNTGERWNLSGALQAIVMDQVNPKTVTNEMEKEESERKPTEFFGVSIGHTEGVLAAVTNNLASGAFLITLFAALFSICGNATVSMIGVILLVFLFFIVVWMFFVNVLKAVMARMFLEGRVYEKVPMRRTAFFLYVGKWRKAAWTMLVQTVFENLWILTIVGGFIKHQSYFCVPYIVAENADVKPMEAIRLSERMMYGHKWECFKLYLSLFGWDVLNALTFGISGFLYSNPYTESVGAEYYAFIRSEAKRKEIEGTEVLNDTYLFERPDRATLSEVYGPAEEYAVTTVIDTKGFMNRVCDIFGICLHEDEYDKVRRYQSEKDRHDAVNAILEGKEYGYKMLPETVKERKNVFEFLRYERRYTLTSLILLFAIFSVFGWIWEVSLHMVQYGNFVNRGVLQGPWLPIYGTGGVLILLVLNKFRKEPVKEFFAAMVLCGVVEYFSALVLSLTHDGAEWWTYQGYFLNVDGRICAEGLLVFGIGGMIFVYFAAPVLDNLIRRIAPKIRVIACVVFLLLFVTDSIYSSFHPNTGEGVTSCVESVTEVL